MTSEDTSLLVAILTHGGTFAAAIGISKIIPYLLDRWKARSERKDNERAAKLTELEKYKADKDKELAELKERVSLMEEELDELRLSEAQTKTTIKTMIPLMKEIMSAHPDFVKMLTQLEANILGYKKTSADGK